MTKTVHCDIVSSEEAIFSGMVEFISITGSLGDLGITPGHSPLLTSIKPGPVELKRPGNTEEVYYISGGFMEVQPDKIIILADTALRADDLNEAATQEAKRQAELALADSQAEFDYSRATAELAEAVAQLRTLKQIKQKMRH